MSRRSCLALPLLATPFVTQAANLLSWFNGISTGQQVTVPQLTYLEERPPAGCALTMWYFWATWCGPCRDTFPHLNGWRSTHAEMEIVAITDEDAAVVGPFVAKVPVSVPIALDTRRQMSGSLKVRAVPYAMAVNRKGTVVWHGQPKGLTVVELKKLITSSTGD